ncbi:hypothetical protein BGW36DRAFT_382143 [Talaromyces proteolyticus]|uniref:Uncharacterized protein n=1 Tax=Talaromyces proteolyticus TaxID=1131652 RepID=A0AAD4PYY0_9EURO|nr:uncharacterized protein BGW36DRAFT_382143 [Talaromyces proteolyticus]KAH8695114.1 hypothetical protein BGW36DRAFT_382143 [Talaromyces proteolyticus]
MSTIPHHLTGVTLIDDGQTPTHSDLRLRPLNVEKGSERFRGSDGFFPPLAATWRCNLTALSQRRNLLFVAYNHQIYVWEPVGPRQILGTKPTIIITPVMKEPNAGGYISREFPHAINNIIVDDLGRDEILLLATDSGNICGYHVETIFSHMEHSRLYGEKSIDLNQHIDPFFCENVGSSAWGLAVHKYARLIAVSANSGRITVFAFALAEPGSEKNENSDFPQGLIDGLQIYGQTWLNVENEEQFEHFQKLIPNRYRSRNVRLSYRGHYTNIPCVTFFNSDLDSDGIWMLSTDIDNRLFVWTIWDQLTPFKYYDFSHGEPLPDILRREERGWSVLALDPRSFRICELYAQACGGKPYLRPHQCQPVLDVTHITQDVPDSAILYEAFPPAIRIDADEPSLPDIFDNESFISDNSNHYLPSHGHARPINLSPSTDKELSAPDQDIDNSIDLDPSQRETNITNIFLPYEDRYQFFWEEDMSDDDGDDGDDGDDSDENEHGEDEDEGDYETEDESDDSSQDIHNFADTQDLIFYMMTSTMENEGASDESSEPGRFKDRTCTDFPILHFSATDIRLLDSPFSKHPTVVCGGPLRQGFARSIYSIHSYDRFNMVKYLPEHGIVIAATQKGRAAVISLARVSNGGLALRINWMLPLASQEKYGERPLRPLLGLAVGPIQGFEMKQDVPDIPYKARDCNDFSFHYRVQGAGEADLYETVSTCGSSSAEGSIDEEDAADMSDNSSATHSSALVSAPDLTYAKSHGIANWLYEPQESWKGWNSSRRYRLLLTYADHTVLSYEFWYEWSDTISSADGRDKGDEGENFLLL